MIGKALPILWSSITKIPNPRSILSPRHTKHGVQMDKWTEHCVRLTTPGLPLLPTQSVRSRTFYCVRTSTSILFPRGTGVCEVPGGSGNVESPRFRLPGPWPASPKKEARKKGFMGKEPSANRIFEIIEPASHHTVTSIWRRPPSALSFSPPRAQARPRCRAPKIQNTTGSRQCQARGKSLLSDPDGTLCVHKSWADFGPPARPGWGSCEPRHARRRRPSS
jgi:hypothetical protein